jgi:hypothetical protein
MNKKSLPEGELESITQSEDNEPIFKKVTNLFRPGFKRLTLVLWFLWFAHRSVQPIIRIAPNELLITALVSAWATMGWFCSRHSTLTCYHPALGQYQLLLQLMHHLKNLFLMNQFNSRHRQ